MRRAVHALVLVTAMTAANPLIAVAQNRPRPEIGAAVAVVGPLSGTADNFKTGYGFGASVLAPITEQMGIQVDYLWSKLDGKAQPAMAPGFDSSMTLQYGTADFVFRGPQGPARLYLLAGAGLYHRAVKLSTSGSGSATICNPWWFVCSPSPMPVQSVAGTHGATDLGINVGAGLSAGRFFVEARYHYVFGPKYSTPSGTQPASGKFFPLTAGVRF